MMKCPFHPDRNPSMKVDQNFICFGCQEKGDVIRFVSKLFGLDAYDAAKKLVVDMNLNVFVGKRIKARAGTRHRAKRIFFESNQLEATVGRIFRAYCDYDQLLKKWSAAYAPGMADDVYHPLFLEAMRKADHVTYILDLLLYGTEEDKALIVIDLGKVVKDLEKRIKEFKSGDREQTSCSIA